MKPEKGPESLELRIPASGGHTVASQQEDIYIHLRPLTTAPMELCLLRTLPGNRGLMSFREKCVCVCVCVCVRVCVTNISGLLLLADQ